MSEKGITGSAAGIYNPEYQERYEYDGLNRMVRAGWGAPGGAEAGSVAYGYGTLSRRAFAARSNGTRTDYAHETDGDLDWERASRANPRLTMQEAFTDWARSVGAQEFGDPEFNQAFDSLPAADPATRGSGLNRGSNASSDPAGWGSAGAGSQFRGGNFPPVPGHNHKLPLSIWRQLRGLGMLRNAAETRQGMRWLDWVKAVVRFFAILLFLAATIPTPPSMLPHTYEVASRQIPLMISTIVIVICSFRRLIHIIAALAVSCSVVYFYSRILVSAWNILVPGGG